MNDPHVEALHYSLRHKEGIDYDRAPSLTRDMPNFTVRVKNGGVEVVMKAHHTEVDPVCETAGAAS